MGQERVLTRKIFGTDGVRGVANIDPMTTEVSMQLGRAVAFLFGQSGRRGRIVIGKDTRLSGYMFETALSAGICSMGADVLLCGPLPTPGIAYITSTMRADAGVVISASHNPYQDNGIKIFARDGFKLPDDVEAEIERLMTSRELDLRRPPASDVGKATRIDDARGRYVVFLKAVFPRERTLDGIKIVVDCAHGAAYRVAPAVFQELGATVYPIGVKPDGRNINLRAGALHPEHMCAAVKKHKADLGIALDGDADRVIISDERGEVVDGDVIMAMVAARMLEQKTLRKKTVVATVMSNLGLERCLEARGGHLLRTAVGDRYVVEEMRRGGYNFGGEQSGHLIFLDHMTTGDGICAGLNVLKIMVEEGEKLSTLSRLMQRYPQVLVNITVRDKRPLEQLPEVVKLIQKVERTLGKEGRVLVRYSGTEPKVRVMVEGPEQRQIKGYADDIARALERACGGVAA
ncbi:MAG TPA: phosphoglucosamine mutase [Polyangia bacterium]|jgi:phosphoglucosamine mutase